MAERVYRVGLPDGSYKLVLSRSRRQAINYAADCFFKVWIASDDELYAAYCDGVEVEDVNGQELIASSESLAN